MYNAKILDVHFFQGVITVLVEFSNNIDSFRDTYSTSQAQPDTWIHDHITKRLKDINSLPALLSTITVGQTIDGLPAPQENAPSPRQQYRSDLARFNRFVSALAMGFTTQQNDEFIALKKKLTDNFLPEYLDLF